MGYEFAVSKTPDNTDDIKINEIAYVWPEERRNQRYKELVGELPNPSLSEEQIAKGILYPEAEQTRLLSLNREEDKNDPTFYPKKAS